ncbi:MAG: sialidase family protein [Verrucomicrobia bacterium]|nr:sialidase family protein [Verrucomicrobiota bacterium]
MHRLFPLVVWLVALASAARGADAPAALGPPPGIVVEASPDPGKIFLASPTIAILPDGTYVVGHDWGGPANPARGTSSVLASRDRGLTWRKLSDLPDLKWASLFVHRGALYYFGVTATKGRIVIHRSTDGGRTWTSPKSATTGLLADGRYGCGPTPTLAQGGRLWHAFEEYGDAAAPRNFRAFMLSAPEEADLLDAASWTRSNAIAFEPRWLNVRTPSWLEGNAVVTPEGRIVNVIRVESHPAPGAAAVLPGSAAGIPRFEVAAMLEISADGRTARFDPERGFLHFIGSESKFTIRLDPQTRRYWSLGSKITNLSSGTDWTHSPHHQRNVMALTSSADLREWREHYRLLSYAAGSAVVKEGSRVGFQYADWQFDGDDLIAVCRTAWGGANYHDANVITFHRLKNFRSLTPADSPPDLAAVR